MAPDTLPAALLAAAQWPGSKQAVLIIGHQPALGATIAALLPFKFNNCPVRKGAIWWLRTRERDGQEQTVVVAVQSPDTL